MKQRDRDFWEKQANDLIESLGAKLVDEWYPWRLETKAGTLILLVQAHKGRKIGGPGTVFTRFDSPPDARELVDCNPYSGKWNHHYFDGWTMENSLADLQYWLRKVL
jgi:hypothetical protein